jgi:hypothetical protein
MKQNPSQPNPPDVWRTKYQDPILQKSTKADFTSDKICNLRHRPPAADAVYWTIKTKGKIKRQR